MCTRHPTRALSGPGRFHFGAINVPSSPMSDITTTHDPILPDAQMNLVRPKEPVIGRVTETRLCMNGKSASYVRHVAIDVSGTPLAGNFLVGQSFGVVPPGQQENGKPHAVRLYSIACPSWGEDGKGNVVSTTPKRLIDEHAPQKKTDDPNDHSLFLGVASNFLCDCNVGDEVMVTGPSGKRFLLPADHNAHDYLFIATGTGIAPFRGMVMELFDHPDGPTTSQVRLVMGTPYTTDLLYHDEFMRYAEKHDNFKYDWAISRERRPDGSRGLYVDRLIAETWDHYHDMLTSPRTLVYICGLLGMQYGFYVSLATHGIADGYITCTGPLAGTAPGDWQSDDIKRYARPTHRCMVEVY